MLPLYARTLCYQSFLSFGGPSHLKARLRGCDLHSNWFPDFSNVFVKETYFVKATFERDLLEIKTKQEHTISVLLSWRRRRWQKLDDVVKMSHVSGINLELILQSLRASNVLTPLTFEACAMQVEVCTPSSLSLTDKNWHVQREMLLACFWHSKVRTKKRQLQRQLDT